LSPQPSEHWFDRLAVRVSRRDVLKGGIGLAGAAFGVTALQPRAAFADDPAACRTGCNWTAHQRYEATFDVCNNLAVNDRLPNLGLFILGGGLGLVAAVTIHAANFAAAISCADRALVQQKADYFDCQQPGCSDFDPKQKGGPCETCTATCCADPTVISGYSCCTLGCACGGTDVGACHSGSTPC
jgi:hypothetical protein